MTASESRATSMQAYLNTGLSDWFNTLHSGEEKRDKAGWVR